MKVLGPVSVTENITTRVGAATYYGTRGREHLVFMALSPASGSVRADVVRYVDGGTTTPGLMMKTGTA